MWEVFIRRLRGPYLIPRPGIPRHMYIWEDLNDNGPLGDNVWAGQLRKELFLRLP